LSEVRVVIVQNMSVDWRGGWYILPLGNANTVVSLPFLCVTYCGCEGIIPDAGLGKCCLC